MQDGTIKVQKGDDADLTFVFKNADGSPYNATGSTLRLQVRRDRQSSPTIDKPITTFTDGGSKAVVTLTKVDLTLAVRAWLYELILTDSAGNRRSSGYLPFYVTENVGQPQTVGVVVGSSQTAVSVSVEQFEPLPGIPLGGTTNQVLSKKSNADNDTQWSTLANVARTGAYVDLTGLPDLSQYLTAAALTPYAKTADVNTALAGYVTSSALSTALGSYLPLTGGTLTGSLYVKGAANADILRIQNSGGSTLARFNLNGELWGERGFKFGPDASTTDPLSGYIAGVSSYVPGGIVFGIRAHASQTADLLRITDNAGTGHYVKVSASGVLTSRDTQPYLNATYSLGSSSLYWSNIFAGRYYMNSTAYFDGAVAGLVALTGNITGSGSATFQGNIVAAPTSGISEIASKAVSGQVAQFGMYVNNAKEWHFEADAAQYRIVESGVDFPITISAAASTGLIGFNREISSRSIKPSSNNSWDLGSSGLFYSNVYGSRHYVNTTAYADGGTADRYGIVGNTLITGLTGDTLVLNAPSGTTTMQRFQANGTERGAVYVVSGETTFRVRAAQALDLGSGATTGRLNILATGQIGIAKVADTNYILDVGGGRVYHRQGAQYTYGISNGISNGIRLDPYIEIGNTELGRQPYIAFNARLTNTGSVNEFTPAYTDAAARTMGILRSGAAAGDLYYRTAAYAANDSTPVAESAFTTRFSITASTGNVGIGVTTATEKLVVDGNIAPNTNGQYSLGTSTTYFSNLYASRQWYNTTAYMDGATAGRIQVTGALGIGTSPANVLDLAVDTNSGITLRNPSGGAGRFTFIGSSGTSYLSAGDGGNSLYFTPGGTGVTSLGTITHHMNSRGMSYIAPNATAAVPLSQTGWIIHRARYWDGTQARDSEGAMRYEVDTSGAVAHDSRLTFYIQGSNSSAQKMHIRSSGDVEVPTGGQGVILKSAGGLRYRVTVNEAGALVTTAL